MVVLFNIFPEGGGERIGWNGFDEDAVIMPYEMEVCILYDNNITASGGLEVEWGDVGVVWSEGPGQQLACITYGANLKLTSHKY